VETLKDYQPWSIVWTSTSVVPPGCQTR
jgi:hypothetical protein